MKPPNRTTQSQPSESIMANNVYMDLSNYDNTSENDTFIFNNISNLRKIVSTLQTVN